MLDLTTPDGKTVLLNPVAILEVTDAPVQFKYHGIVSMVRTTSHAPGRSIGVRESVEAIRDKLAGVAPSPGRVLVPEDCTDEIAEAIAQAANCCGGIAESIWRAAVEVARKGHT